MVLIQTTLYLKERACIVLFDLRVQLGAADGLQILFLLAAGSQQPFTARPGPKIRLGADRMKFRSCLRCFRARENIGNYSQFVWYNSNFLRTANLYVASENTS